MEQKTTERIQGLTLTEDEAKLPRDVLTVIIMLLLLLLSPKDGRDNGGTLGSSVSILCLSREAG